MSMVQPHVAKLKKTDPVSRFLRSIFDALSKRPKLIWVGTAIAVVAVSSIWMASRYRLEREGRAGDHYYDAVKSRRELESKGPVIPNGMRAQVTDLVELIDRKYRVPNQIANRVISDFPGTPAEFEANYFIGSIYFDEGAPAVALGYYERTMGKVKGSDKQRALKAASGYALENLGKHAEAAKRFADAIAQGGKALNLEIKADLLMGQARNLALNGDREGASKIYKSITEEFADSTTAQSAKALLNQLSLSGAK